MATRQYIGARYVPKFADPIAWVKENSYEALTIVTYLNNSYTSKKPVPANTDITNTEYWVVTGNYNAQVEEYRQVTVNVSEELTNEISDRKNTDKLLATKKREMILIGDSYTGVIDSGHLNGKGWLPYIKENFNQYANFYNSQTPLGGVYGFASSRPFLDVLKDCEQYIDDFSKITDIVVLGGTNDIPIETSIVENAISEFCTYCKTNFVNAKIRIGNIGNHIFDLSNGAYKNCIKYGAEYIKDTLMLMCDPQYVSDGTHLTQAGYDFYNPYVAECVMFGHTDYCFEINYPLTNTLEATTDIRYLNCRITNSSICYGFRNETKGTVPNLSYSSNPELMTTIFTLPELFHIPITYNPIVFEAYAYSTTNKYLKYGNAYIVIKPDNNVVLFAKTLFELPADYTFNTYQYTPVAQAYNV